MVSNAPPPLLLFGDVDFGQAPARPHAPAPRNHNHPPELIEDEPWELPLGAPVFGTDLKGMFREVCWRRGLRPSQVALDIRTRPLSRARWEYFTIAREVRRADGSRRYSLPMIGASLVRFGRPLPMDHTSVMHGLREYKKLLAQGIA
jgi:hypothetical protein